MPHTVGAAAQRDCQIAADHRLLAAGAATLAGLAVVAGAHEYPARGVGPAGEEAADGAAAVSAVEGSDVEGNDSPSGPEQASGGLKWSSSLAIA